MDSVRFRKMTKNAAQAAGAAFRESRLESGETQQELAQRVGKNGNSHIARLEQRATSMGDVIALNHRTGHPERSLSMVRAGHYALEPEDVKEFEHLTSEELNALVKDALDNGTPSEAWRPAIALKQRAKTYDELAAALNAIGNVYREQGELTEAMGMYATCISYEGEVKDRTKIDRSRVNLAGTFRLFGDLRTAQTLISDLKREPLANQQRGFLFMERAFLAEARGRDWSSWRGFRLAQELFNQVGNDAYAATAEARALRVQVLYGDETARARAREGNERLMNHTDHEARGLAFAFAYEDSGDCEHLRGAERIAEERNLSTVKEAIARARRRRNPFRNGKLAAIAILLTLLPLLTFVGNALAKADT
jgi:transcriptional regulator with XRE-family HTH domain